LTVPNRKKYSFAIFKGGVGGGLSLCFVLTARLMRFRVAVMFFMINNQTLQLIILFHVRIRYAIQLWQRNQRLEISTWLQLKTPLTHFHINKCL